MLGLSATAQNILFTNLTVSFTNSQGTVYSNITLVKGNNDGIIWHDAAAGGGMVPYYTVPPTLLQAWGVSTNMIKVSAARAAHKKVADEKFRAEQQAYQAADAKAKAVADAEWKAGAPTREREQERSKIKELEQRIEDEDDLLRHTQAAADDFNRSGTPNAYAYGPSAQRKENLTDARKRLQKMKDAFVSKYGVSP
jgi:hypothetical protein